MNLANTKKFDHLSDEKQQIIIDASVAEFADNGFKNASVNKIVEQAGIAKGSLFNYFKSKSLLFEYVYTLALKEVKAYLARVRDESNQDEFFTRLSKIIDAGINFIEKHPLLAKIYFRLLNSDDSPRGKKIIKELHNEAVNYLEGFVKIGIERGELRDTDTMTAAFLLESVINRILQTYYLDLFNSSSKINKNDRQWIDQIVETIKTGMSK